LYSAKEMNGMTSQYHSRHSLYSQNRIRTALHRIRCIDSAAYLTHANHHIDW